jgi:C-terminal processing protease CtpA/Prc
MKKKAKKSGNLNFKKFALEAINAANTEGVKNLVIDLRANGGGDMRIPEQLFYLLDFDVKKTYHFYSNLSQYYKTHLKDDARADAKKYEKATGKSLVFDGRLLNIDSIVAEKTVYDFYENVKNPKSDFYIAPDAPRFRGKVYFITGMSTGSAAGMTATLVKDNGLATIVGIPTGNKSTAQTGGSGFKLPNSKVTGAMSYFYVERPNTAKNDETALQPDVEIWQNLEDWYRGVDTQMAWIIKDIAARKSGK